VTQIGRDRKRKGLAGSRTRLQTTDKIKDGSRGSGATAEGEDQVFSEKITRGNFVSRWMCEGACRGKGDRFYSPVWF